VPERVRDRRGRPGAGLTGRTGGGENDGAGAPPALRFTEQMQGYFADVAGPDGGFLAGETVGRASGQTMSTWLTITYPDLPALLADPSTPAGVTGVIDAPSLGDGGLEVTSGTFELLVPDPSHVQTDHMLYRLRARSRRGVEYRLSGCKILRHGPAVRAWRETTTLFVTVDRLLDDGSWRECGRGVLRVSLRSLLRLLASMEVHHVARRLDRRRYRYRFASHFLGSLLPFYGGMFDEQARFPAPPPSPGRLPEPGGRPPDAVRWCDPDGAWHDREVPDACSRLIRYQGGGKGPVMLAAGYAMSATSFALETEHPSLLQYLIDHHYDVWLFDFRAGIDLPSAWSQATIDDIATIDWPRAVDEVRRIAGCHDVQAFGHCVGSVSLLMTLLNGTEGIRSAVCAQFTVHPVTSRLNRTKASLHLGSAMARLGISRLSPDAALRPGDIALDLALRPVPVPRGERCGLAVCRWINAIYGCTHVHDQLDEATHRQISTLFGVGNLTGLRHLILMLQRGRAVDADGGDRYLPHVERLDLPIHFLSGTRNYIFHPAGVERTLDWLRAAFGPEVAAQNFSVTYLDGYGHLDALIGRHAPVDVFPHILEHLDAHALDPGPRLRGVVRDPAGGSGPSGRAGTAEPRGRRVTAGSAGPSSPGPTPAR
jgi:cholesterol oxidase